MQGLIVADTLCKQKTLETIDVLDPFVNERLALRANTAAVLFFICWSLDHRTHARLATFVRQQSADVRQQSADESLSIDPVGLCAPTAARSRNRGWIDNVAFNAVALKSPMDPEAIQPRLLNSDDLNRTGLLGGSNS